MDYNNLDEDYLTIVDNIINNDKFLKLKNYKHHGISRFEHSLKVSYNSYKFAKKYNLDYKEAAVGGLLHDFFLEENKGIKKRLISIFTHPKKAMNNSSNIFKVNNKEKNIIKSHMFPLNIYIPKYKESWIVSLYDKKVAISEFILRYGHKLCHMFNFILIMSINFI